MMLGNDGQNNSKAALDLIQEDDRPMETDGEENGSSGNAPDSQIELNTDPALQIEAQGNRINLPHLQFSFKLGSLLGQGSFGTVHFTQIYRGGKENCSCALKSSPNRAPHNFLLKKEARILAYLRKGISPHPNIVAFVAFAEEVSPGFSGLFMEYCPGGELFYLLAALEERGNSLSISFVLNYGVQLASALCFLHQHGIIHGDVKLENIFLTQDLQQVKLGDFGLAKHTDKLAEIVTGLRVVNPMEGSLFYLSAEAINHAQRSERTDQHAYGIVLYRMLSGGQLPAPFQYGVTEATLNAFCQAIVEGCYPQLGNSRRIPQQADSAKAIAEAELRDEINQCWQGLSGDIPSFSENWNPNLPIADNTPRAMERTFFRLSQIQTFFRSKKDSQSGVTQQAKEQCEQRREPRGDLYNPPSANRFFRTGTA